MKFSNEKKIARYKIAYGFLIGVLVAYYIYNWVLLEGAFSSIESLALFITFFLALFYWYKKATYFEYDSSGLGLVIIRKGILLSEYANYREQRIEIPKKNLYKYKYRNYIFTKKVCLYIKTSHKIKKTSVDVTLLSNKKIKALQASLDKVVRENSSVK